MVEEVRSLFVKLQDVLHPEYGCENNITKEGANNFPTVPGDLTGTKLDERAFKSLFSYVKQTILKPWSDNQAEFLVLTCYEDSNLNQVNYVSVLSSFVFATSDKTFLEKVKGYIKSHCDQYHPNVGSLMNNLGVKFSESALYKESEDCFKIAKNCFQHRKDHLKAAVITLNQAVLEKALGKYEKAEVYAATAASLCHDISMRMANDSQLPAKLLRRVSDMLQEFGNHQMLDKILRTVVYFDIPGANETASAVLSRQLMKIQLEGMTQNIQAKKVNDFISHLYALLDKPDASKISMNAEFLRIVINAAKICHSTGQCREAYKLLKKLQSIFLPVHGESSFLYGSLLYQIGCFLHGSGKFGEAETALKQAEGILAWYCGENHHLVALCRNLLGSCILLKGNAKDALEHLNKALTMFKKLNPIHPEIGEILLKRAFLYAEERNFQQAQETVQEAEAIFISSCGEVSCKTASAFFQVGMVLQKFKEFRALAVDKFHHGIEMLLNLGINANHPDVMYWNSFLGVLKHSLGMVEEAEKCFIDVQKCVPFCDDPGSKKTKIITPEYFLHSQDRADDGRGRSSLAQVISLVNLVDMKGGNERLQYLDKLVCHLIKEKIEEIQMRDIAGQDFYLLSHQIPLFNRPAVLIILVSLADRLEADDGTDFKMFLVSSAKKSHFGLFLRIQSGGMEMTEVSCLASSFRESVNVLFLQPKFRKGYAEGEDLYMELPAPADPCDISSLSGHLDCLPLLVELELTKSQEQSNDFDYLTSWQSSVNSVKSLAHVSYFSYRCDNQREAEFVFDHLIQTFGQKLALNGFQEVAICDVSPEENVATFVVQEPQNLFLNIVVKNLSIVVKCCSVKESGSNCYCFSVRNALNITIESLSEIVSVNFKPSAWLACKGSGSVSGHEESLSGNCSQSVNNGPVGSDLTSETGNSTIPGSFLSCRSTEADLKRKQTVGKLQIEDGEDSRKSLTHHCEACNEILDEQVSRMYQCQPHKSSICSENANIIHPLHHPRDECHNVDVGLCLLECLLNQSRSVSYGNEELSSSGLSSTDVGGCGSYIPHNDSLSSILSSGTSSSLNSGPTSPSTFSLACHNLFTSTKSPCADASSDVVYVCGNRECLSDNSLIVSKCNGQSVKLQDEPSQSHDACQLQQSSSEENLPAEQSCSFPETKETKQSKAFSINNASGAEDVLICSIDHDQKAAAQNILSKDTDSSVVNDDGKFLATNCLEDVCANKNSKQNLSVEPHQSIPGPLFTAVSGKTDTGTTTNNCFRPLLANLEDALAASLQDCYELEQQIRKLEEKLKQFQEEKRELQADLGRYLFLEEKEKRCKRLRGGATSVQEPGLTMHSRLLEISNSLSSAEVKKIKFMVKSRVNRLRLARVTEAFELFEELETNGLFPLNYIGQLLDGIQRSDLVEKLGIHVPLSGTKKGSNSSFEQHLSNHASNSHEPIPVHDNFLDDQTDGHEMEKQLDYAPSISSSKNSFELPCSDENGTSLRTEEKDHDHSQCSSILSVGSSGEEESDIPLSSKNVENVVQQAKESPQLSSPLDVTFLSNSSCSSSDLLANADETALATSYHTSPASFEGDGLQVKSVSSRAASGYSNSNSTREDTQGISEVLTRPGEESEDEDTQVPGACVTNGEKRVEKSVDICDGAVMTVPYSTKTCSEGTKTDSLVGSDYGSVRIQTGANGGSVSSTQQHAFLGGGSGIIRTSSDVTDWKRQGARPKETQRTVVEKAPAEPVVYITDGLAGDFLARHTQDKALHDSIYNTGGMPFFNDILSQGTSHIDGNMSQSNRAQPYFGNCRAASATEPYGRFGNTLASGPDGHLGGFSYGEPFSNNSGPWPNHFGDSFFSLYSNYLSRNTAANSYSLQSDFVHRSSRFAAVGHFDGPTYLPPAQQVSYPPTASDPVLNSYSGMTGSSFADPPWTGAAQTQHGDPEYDVQRFTSTLNEQLADPVQDAKKYAANGDSSALMSDQGTDEPAQEPNVALGNLSATTNTGDVASSTARYQSGNSSAFGDDVLVGGSAHRTSILEPHIGDADSSRGSGLNNRDFGTDSVESSDNSLLALERRVAEACTLVERVLREREEREQFGKEIERKEQLIREQRARKKREKEERELREAESWPQQQEAITARSQWLCEHYQRHCRVRFPCCTQFYPCHRCHNISKACENEETKACHATHLKCSHCQHEQEIGEDSAKCRKCGGKMSAYFCAICKHFTSVDKNPYHCDKCGICRIHQDKSFHCEVCNVCLDKRLEGNHKCRPDSGHDECCICLEDAFSGCQILPCSHKVHRECAIAMIQNGIRTCPICRHPLYSTPRE